MIDYVVSFSGGIGSWGAAKRTADRYGTANLRLLFADTLIEDEDLYRFFAESAPRILGQDPPSWLLDGVANIPPLEEAGVDGRRESILPLAARVTEEVPGVEWIAEGHDPWEIFFKRRMIGGIIADPCSHELKRMLIRKWMDRHYTPENVRMVLGIDWQEAHRFDGTTRANGDHKPGARERWLPWIAEAPLCEPPLFVKGDLLAQLEEFVVEPPRMYAEGFTHNNCGGFCVKAGQAAFAHLLRMRRGLYLFHERREQEFREFIGKDVAILKERSGPDEGKPLTMRKLRLRLEKQPSLFDATDDAACGLCMA